MSGAVGGVNIRISWPMLGLGVVLAAVIVAAVLQIGPPTSSARTAQELVTAEKGVVQSTVTGTGNVEAGTDVQANFQAGGTLQNVYVKAGEPVIKGQLLATLDPTSAQLAVDQAQLNLTSAEDQLTNADTQAAAASSSTTTTGTRLTVPESTAAQFISFRPTATTATTTTATATAPATTTTPMPTPPTTTTTTRTATTLREPVRLLAASRARGRSSRPRSRPTRSSRSPLAGVRRCCARPRGGGIRQCVSTGGASATSAT